MTSEDELEVYESGKGLNIEPGLYPASVASVTPVEGQFGNQWQFAFSLDEYPDEEPWAWASAKLGTKTKLYRWAGILLGHTLAVGERVTPSDLIGKRCQLVIKEDTVDGETLRKVDDIMREKGTVQVVTNADRKADTDATCFCGAPVASYSPTGEPLCAEHAAEPDVAELEAAPSATTTAIPVAEMKSRYDFQREAHKHFKIKTLAEAIRKAGFSTTMDVKDWGVAWALLCEKMAEPSLTAE